MRQESSPPYLPPEPSVSFIHSRLTRRKETEAGTGRGGKRHAAERGSGDWLVPRRGRARPSGALGSRAPRPPAPATSSARVHHLLASQQPRITANGTKHVSERGPDLGDVEGVDDDGGDEGGACGGGAALGQTEVLIPRRSPGEGRLLRAGGGGGAAAGEVDARGGGGDPGGEAASGAARHSSDDLGRINGVRGGAGRCGCDLALSLSGRRGGRGGWCLCSLSFQRSPFGLG